MVGVALVATIGAAASAAAPQWIEPSHVLQQVHGVDPAGQLGSAVARVGDCDGDGVPDFAVGAPYHSAGGASAGRVVVYSGATGEPLFHRDGLKGDQLGLALAGGGDVDGDGVGDVLVGAPQRYEGPGRVLVLSGADGSVLIDLNGLARSDRFGAAVEFVGDFDADGRDDFVVGAPGHNPVTPDGELRDGGRAAVYSGRTGDELASLHGTLYRGRLGASVAGHFDARQRLLVVGEPGTGKDGRGRVHVFRERKLEPAFTIEGDAHTTGLGGAYVSVVGDVNADGFQDVYASDWKSGVHGDLTGLAVVHSGRTGERLLTLVGESANEGFGSGDGRVGDVDGDGHDDLLIGAWLSRDAADKGGKVVLVSGATGKELRRWTGIDEGAALGFDATGMGDVDGDGQLDFLFSAALTGCPTGDQTSTGGSSRPGKKASRDCGAVFLVSGEVCDPGEHVRTVPLDLPTMETANGLFRGRDFEAAAQAYHRITKARPDEMRAWFFLGLSYHYLERYEDALEAHLRAAMFPEVAVPATYNAACAHALLGNTDQAFLLLRKAMAYGFDDLRHIEADRDLASLHSDPRWKEIIPAADSLGDFVEPEAIVLHELTGSDPGSHFGWALAVPGDCDGDGVDDLLVSAPYHERDDHVVGRVDLFSGRSGERLRHWLGEPQTGFGKALAGVGDLDGDGVSEFVVGAPGGRGGIGRIHVFSGSDGEELFRHEGRGVGDLFGRVVAGIGDYDGDGIVDLAVGASGDGTSLEADGFVELLSGRDGTELARLRGRTQGERFGSAVAGRFDEHERVLLVGAQDGGPGSRGRVYVFRDDLDVPEFVIENAEGGVDLGRIHVTLVPDRNGDGRSEILCADWRFRAKKLRTGKVCVFSGDGGELLGSHAGLFPGEGFGIGAVLAGDFDGDGVADLLAGAWLSQEGAEAGGKAYAFSGRDGSPLATWTSSVRQGRFGSDVAGIGDVNGDGIPDVVVGAPARARLSDRPGRVYVLSGASVRADRTAAKKPVVGPLDDEDR